MRLVAIFCWGLMILVKTWLDCASTFFIEPSYGRVASGVLVDLMVFPICFMCIFSVTMDGGICFISYTFRLGHV